MALGLGLLALIGTIQLRSTAEYEDSQPFNSETWRQSLAQGTTDPIRIRMIDDLLRRHQLKGKTRRDIEKLLGRPPKTEYLAQYEYVYWLGPERGYMRIDSEWLGLQFDSTDRVSRVSLLRD